MGRRPAVGREAEIAQMLCVELGEVLSRQWLAQHGAEPRDDAVRAAVRDYRALPVEQRATWVASRLLDPNGTACVLPAAAVVALRRRLFARLRDEARRRGASTTLVRVDTTTAMAIDTRCAELNIPTRGAVIALLIETYGNVVDLDGETALGLDALIERWKIASHSVYSFRADAIKILVEAAISNPNAPGLKAHTSGKQRGQPK